MVLSRGDFSIVISFFIIHLFSDWIFICFFPLVYYMSGSYAWIFLVLTTLHYVKYINRKAFTYISVLWILAGTMVYLSHMYVFSESLLELIQYPYLKTPNKGINNLYILLVIFVSVTPFIKRLPINFSNIIQNKFKFSVPFVPLWRI